MKNLIDEVEILKTILQISGVITSIMALYYLRYSQKKTKEIIEGYPKDHPLIAKSKYLGFVKIFIKTGIFSSLTIFLGFAGFWSLLINKEEWFDLFFYLANGFFFLTIFLILLYFLSQHELATEQKEEIEETLEELKK